MFHGPPLPLLPGVSLGEILAFSRPPRRLGAWVRGAAHRFHIHPVPHRSRSAVLASSDLGFLLACCKEVVVREGERTVVLAAETVIQWRALQVATATPYLPGFERLRDLFPGLQATSSGFVIPLQGKSPEEVLAHCLGEGVQVARSCIRYPQAMRASSTASPAIALG